jgi:hypothetical protein
LKGLGVDFYGQSNFWKDDDCRLNLTTVYGMDHHGNDYSPHNCVTMILKECPKNVSIYGQIRTEII